MNPSLLANSPGRGSSGKVRNFKAMSPEKLAGVISDLESFGMDQEAYDLALAAAGRPPAKLVDVEVVPVSKAERDMDPIGLLPGKMPMKAKDQPDVVTAVGRHDAILEPKFDGHRCLVHVTDTVTLYCPSVDKTRLVPHIAEEIQGAVPAGSWLDGELIAMEGATAGWGSVQQVMGSGEWRPESLNIDLMLFDVIALDGKDIRLLEWYNRRELLERIGQHKQIGKHVKITPTYPATQAKLDELLDAGMEGVIVKWTDSVYRCGARGPGYNKVKVVATHDVVITGFTEGEAGFTGLIGAITFGAYKGGTFVELGKCSGMSMDERIAFTNDRAKYIGQVMEFKFNGQMPTGGYRNPQFLRLRIDKTAEDCTWDD